MDLRKKDPVDLWVKGLKIFCAALILFGIIALGMSVSDYSNSYGYQCRKNAYHMSKHHHHRHHYHCYHHYTRNNNYCCHKH